MTVKEIIYPSTLVGFEMIFYNYTGKIYFVTPSLLYIYPPPNKKPFAFYAKGANYFA